MAVRDSLFRRFFRRVALALLIVQPAFFLLKTTRAFSTPEEYITLLFDGKPEMRSRSWDSMKKELVPSVSYLTYTPCTMIFPHHNHKAEIKLCQLTNFYSP